MSIRAGSFTSASRIRQLVYDSLKPIQSAIPEKRGGSRGDRRFCARKTPLRAILGDCVGWLCFLSMPGGSAEFLC